MTMMNWFEETPIISPVYFGDAYTDSEAKRELCRVHLAKFVRENRHARGCIESTALRCDSYHFALWGADRTHKSPRPTAPFHKQAWESARAVGWGKLGGEFTTRHRNFSRGTGAVFRPDKCRQGVRSPLLQCDLAFPRQLRSHDSSLPARVFQHCRCDAHNFMNHLADFGFHLILAFLDASHEIGLHAGAIHLQ